MTKILAVLRISHYEIIFSPLRIWKKRITIRNNGWRKTLNSYYLLLILSWISTITIINTCWKIIWCRFMRKEVKKLFLNWWKRNLLNWSSLRKLEGASGKTTNYETDQRLLKLNFPSFWNKFNIENYIQNTEYSYILVIILFLLLLSFLIKIYFRLLTIYISIILLR